MKPMCPMCLCVKKNVKKCVKKNVLKNVLEKIKMC